MFERASENFSFTGKFKIFAAISIILCTIGLGGLILSMFGVPALNLDIDFVGGVQTQIELSTPVDREIQSEIEAIYREVAGVSASVTTSGDSGTAVTVKTVEISSEMRDEAYNKIVDKYGKDKVSLLETQFVTAAVGNDLKRSALLSLALAGVLILIYISIRFEFSSGLAAIICLLHDVMVMLAFFVLFRIPMNMTFIAAALTIIGYSINATIVVFDRVRENYKRQGSSGDFAAVVDKSVWQTMRRSVGTTITTLLPVLLIIIIGVSSIKVFAIPLAIGIVAGSFSSTCIAGPVWNLLKGIKKSGK